MAHSQRPGHCAAIGVVLPRDGATAISPSFWSSLVPPVLAPCQKQLFGVPEDAARLHDPELSKASIAQALAAATASKNDLTQTGNVDKIQQLARTKYYLDDHWALGRRSK